MMRAGAGHAGFGSARRLVGALVGAAVVCQAVGCASAYEQALREMGAPGENRLERRVQELVECAEHAVDCLERAASWYAARGADAPVASDAREVVLVNDCASAVFEFSRRALSVGDVAPGAGAEVADAVAQLQRSIASSERALGGAVEALEGARDHGVVSGLDGAVGLARSEVESLVRDARVITKG